MKKVYFRNTENWQSVYALVFDKNEEKSEELLLTECDVDGDLVLCLGDPSYDHLYFTDGGAERTGKVYLPNVPIGVEYKKNEGMGKNLTYIFAKGIESTGRVENFTLEDAKNLSYREDKSKKISVFLPSGYDGEKKYDILYFFDAQNLFGLAGKYTDNGDPYGSWQLDSVLRALGKETIVVGIDNADRYRDQELFMDPSDFGTLAPLATALPEEDYSHGQLDGLLDFILQTLHPYIRENYFVKEDNIGIGGSSMGGIASFYCGLREPSFFGYVLSYSPAFGLYEMSAFERFFAKKGYGDAQECLPKIHIYCGGGDMLEQMLLPHSKAMKKVLVRFGYPREKVFETFDDEKPHNEESWRLVLPQSFEYLT